MRNEWEIKWKNENLKIHTENENIVFVCTVHTLQYIERKVPHL